MAKHIPLNFMHSRKAATTVHPIMWIARMLLIILPFYLSLGFIIDSSISSALSTANLEGSILFNRIINSKESVFFEDQKTGRDYNYIVDLDKFNDGTLANLFSGADSKFGARLSLETDQGTKEIFLNRNFYETGVIRLTKSDMYDGITQTIPVSAFEGGSYAGKGKLTITVVFQVA